MTVDVQRLRDRIEELESILGVSRSITGRIRDVFKLEFRQAQIVGMLLAREFVPRDGLYTVLYTDLPESEWPNEKILDAQMSKLRPRLEPFGIFIETKWGEGWFMTRESKAMARSHLSRPDGPLPVVSSPPIAPKSGPSVRERRLSFLDGP